MTMIQLKKNEANPNTLEWVVFPNTVHEFVVDPNLIESMQIKYSSTTHEIFDDFEVEAVERNSVDIDIDGSVGQYSLVDMQAEAKPVLGFDKPFLLSSSPNIVDKIESMSMKDGKIYSLKQLINF